MPYAVTATKQQMEQRKRIRCGAGGCICPLLLPFPELLRRSPTAFLPFIGKKCDGLLPHCSLEIIPITFISSTEASGPTPFLLSSLPVVTRRSEALFGVPASPESIPHRGSIGPSAWKPARAARLASVTVPTFPQPELTRPSPPSAPGLGNMVCCVPGGSGCRWDLCAELFLCFLLGTSFPPSEGWNASPRPPPTVSRKCPVETQCLYPVHSASGQVSVPLPGAGPSWTPGIGRQRSHEKLWLYCISQWPCSHC